MATWALHEGDCLAVLPTLEAGSVGSVATDPPYGIRFMGKAWDGADIERETAVRRANPSAYHDPASINGGYRSVAAEAGRYDQSGKANRAFQEWCEAWARECLRVLKPGGYLVSFGSPRTYHRMACAIEDAGFVIKDSLMWIHGQGFPKSLNLGDGYGTALKPAHEPIILAQKPLQGTYAANVARHGVGCLNIDGCRVATTEIGTARDDRREDRENWRFGGGSSGSGASDPLGRWPTNLLLAHHPDCMPVGTRRVRGHTIGSRGAGGQHGAYSPIGAGDGHQYTDADGMETVEAWQCVPSCPVAVLDAQSGTLSSNSGQPFTRNSDAGRQVYGAFDGNRAFEGYYGDSGGASRFYPTFRFEADDFAPFLYVAKAARSEREKGLRPLVKATPGERTGRKEGSAGLDSPRAGAGRTNAGANIHPTVKPLALMRWLVRLITPPGQTVLDPFLGSGTTGVAALMEGRGFVGIEREAAYLAIARRRMETTQPGMDLAAAAAD